MWVTCPQCLTVSETQDLGVLSANDNRAEVRPHRVEVVDEAMLTLSQRMYYVAFIEGIYLHPCRQSNDYWLTQDTKYL